MWSWFCLCRSVACANYVFQTFRNQIDLTIMLLRSAAPAPIIPLDVGSNFTHGPTLKSASHLISVAPLDDRFFNSEGPIPLNEKSLLHKMPLTISGYLEPSLCTMILIRWTSTSTNFLLTIAGFAEHKCFYTQNWSNCAHQHHSTSHLTIPSCAEHMWIHTQNEQIVK